MQTNLNVRHTVYSKWLKTVKSISFLGSEFKVVNTYARRCIFHLSKNVSHSKKLLGNNKISGVVFFWCFIHWGFSEVYLVGGTK